MDCRLYNLEGLNTECREEN